MVSFKKMAEFQRHQGPIYALAQGRSAHTVFSAGADGLVAEWDLKQIEPVAFRVEVGHSIFSLRTIPEKGLLLIGRASGALHVVDLEERKEIRLLELHRRGVFDITFDRERDRILTAGGDGLLSVLDGESFELLRSIPLAEKKLRKLDLDQQNGRLAVASGDARVHVLDTEMYNELLTLNCHAPGANAVKFLPEWDRLLTAGRDGHLDIWDLQDPEEPLFHLPAHYYPIYSIVKATSGNIVATAARDKSIKCWDPRSGEFLGRIERKREGEGHTRSVNALHWSKGTGHLVSTGDDGRVMVWEPETYSKPSSSSSG